MSIRNTLLAVFVLLVSHTEYAAAEISQMRGDFNVEVMAIDDEGEPVEAASLGFSWGMIGGKSPDTGFERKLSDQGGKSRFSGKTVFREFAYGGKKDGYYSNGGLHGSFLEKMNGEWQPSPLQLSVVLKRVRNPVPMYAKEINLILPREGERLALDLVEGDWVAPFGKGKERDIEFCFEGQYQSKINYDGTLTLRFLGDGSGILPYDYDQSSNSELKMPYEAPMSGYIPTWSWRNARMTSPEKFARSIFNDDTKLPRGFVFRLRTVVDSKGEVVSAMYGKIQGRFYFRIHEEGSARVIFTYYLNPDMSRNLEFDPERNLFPGERVVEP